MRAYTYQAQVLDVLSGDGLRVRLDLGFGVFTEVEVKLAGYVAPVKGRPGADLARTYLIEVIKAGNVIVATRERTPQGWWVADVVVGNGLCASTAMREFANSLLIK